MRVGGQGRLVTEDPQGATFPPRFGCNPACNRGANKSSAACEYEMNPSYLSAIRHHD
jgi:hypothetical protein